MIYQALVGKGGAFSAVYLALYVGVFVCAGYLSFKGDHVLFLVSLLALSLIQVFGRTKYITQQLSKVSDLIRYLVRRVPQQILPRYLVMAIFILSSEQPIGGMLVYCILYVVLAYSYFSFYSWIYRIRSKLLRSLPDKKFTMTNVPNFLARDVGKKSRRLRIMLRPSVYVFPFMELFFVYTLIFYSEKSLFVIQLTLALIIIFWILSIVGISLLRSAHHRSKNGAKDHLNNISSEITEYQPDIIVYFSAPNNSFYHLQQWVPIFNQSSLKFIYLVREKYAVSGLKKLTGSPIVFLKALADIGRIDFAPCVVLYINNGQKNTGMTRTKHLRHIFLHHGESDKMASTNPIVKIYDKLFLAGEIAHQRYAKADIELKEGQYELIGRPMTDAISVKGSPPKYKEFATERIGIRYLSQMDKVGGFSGSYSLTILYAPTFEGYYEDDNSSSIAMGLSMLRQLSEEIPDVRIIFKPHPLTGSVIPAYRDYLAEIYDFIRSLEHGYIIGKKNVTELTDLFNLSDILIADISSVPVDYLQSEKPCVITDPKSKGAQMLYEESPTIRGFYIIDKDLDGFQTLIRLLLENDVKKEDRRKTKALVLSQYAGKSNQRFCEVLEKNVKQVKGLIS
jgi:hypothetical protein